MAVKKNGPLTVPALVKAYRRTVPGQNSRCKDKTFRFKARATLKKSLVTAVGTAIRSSSLTKVTKIYVITLKQT